MITNDQLRDTYLDEAMLRYFRAKLSHLPDQELQWRIEETLKFLFIASECTGPIPVSRDIDEIWHYWILQTQEYEKLCGLLPTKNFIHHSSNDYLRYFDSSIGEGNDIALDVKMLALYTANFGSFEEKRTKYWLFAEHLVRQNGWEHHQLNDWLSAPRVLDNATEP